MLYSMRTYKLCIHYQKGQYSVQLKAFSKGEYN